MAARPGRRHAMLLFTVLAGLFLMHGFSAPSMHGMPMRMSCHTASVMPPQATAPDAISGAMPTIDHMQTGETCTAMPLKVSVAEDGKPVAGLEPYLETYAHLSGFHAGDLAMAHLHPQGGVATTPPADRT